MHPNTGAVAHAFFANTFINNCQTSILICFEYDRTLSHMKVVTNIFGPNLDH